MYLDAAERLPPGARYWDTVASARLDMLDPDCYGVLKAIAVGAG
jgi:hypothetical protein